MKKHSLRTFYILILTQMFSIIGSNMTSFAVGIQVYRETSQATPLALVGFFGLLPMLIAAGTAGVLADRWNRRYVLAAADAGQAVGTLLLLLSFATDSFQLWHLYVISGVQSVFDIFQRPAFTASITMLVPDEHRDRANAIQQITGPTGRLIAPVFAGFLYSLIGLTGVLSLDLFTFLVAITVVLSVSIPQPSQTGEGERMAGNRWQQATAGIRYLYSKKPLFYNTLYSTIPNFLTNGALILLTPYLLSLHESEELLGVLTAALGGGHVVGGLIMSAWGGTRPRIHTLRVSALLQGLFLALLGVVRSPLALGVTLFFVLFWNPIGNAAYMSILQRKIPPDLQGRVMSALLQIGLIITPLAFLISGPLADQVFEPAVGGTWWRRVEPLMGAGPGSGMGLIFLISGLLMTAATAAIYLVPSITQMEDNLPDYDPAESPPPES